ncbi:MAG: FAD-binding protein, partial [Candidatus Electrothrix sp. LOE2]|nr:FAD-binding protein [Candidatus Electrothrix sp. LOE2]
MFSRRDFLRISAMASAAALVNWQFPHFARSEGAGEGEYDVIVIGAGLGGLSSAALLAMNGLRPLVIDKRDVAGGYASSFQRPDFTFQRGNFTCEVALHGITGNPLSQVLLQQLGVLDKLALIPHTYSWNSIYPDFPVNLPQPPFHFLQPFLQPPIDLEAMSAQLGGYLNLVFFNDNPIVGPVGISPSLVNYFPDETEGLQMYMQCWRELLFETIKFYSAEHGMPDDLTQFPVEYPTWASMLWKKRHMKAKTLDDLFREYKIKSPELKAILGQSWPYYGTPSSEIPAWFYLMTTGMYHAFGNFYLLGNPENNPDSVDMFGSSQDLSNLLMKSITNPPTPAGAPFPFPGGEIFLSTEVTEIILHPETGRAVGVKTNSGAEYYAKAVISNASVPQTFELLLSSSEVPKDYLKTVSKYEPSTSHFNVWLGVELPEDQDDPFRKAYDKLASNT